MTDIVLPPQAHAVVPAMAFLVKAWLNQETCALLGPSLATETAGRMRSQMTYNKGWPARVDKGHCMARFGDPEVTYTYKGKPKPMYPLTPSMLVVRTELVRTIGWTPNCVVVNAYAPESGLYPHRDGNYIPQLGDTPIIASVSFGATRTFTLFPADPATNKRAKGAPPVHVQLASGDLFVMYGQCDRRFHHGIPEEPTVEGTRLSLTFRRHLT